VNIKFLAGILGLAFLASGCASTQPPSTLNQLQIKVAQLERKIEDKDEELTSLKKRVEDIEDDLDGLEPYSVVEPSFGNYRETAPAERIKDVRSVPATVKDEENIIRVSAGALAVQQALKKSGYYTGAVDGKAGPATKKAVENFQKDQGLKVDGIVGQQTWDRLRAHAN
jgi:murein L,D-transpeptidase YcbB/YkuD